VADPTYDEVHRALTRLANALTGAKDDRQYGVNCGIRVIDALRRGESVDAIITRFVPGFRPAGEPKRRRARRA
jgi:hypothetical protein